MNFSDSHHLRKMVAGACMVAAPLLFLVGFIVSPRLETGAVAQLKTASANVDRYYIANLLAMVGLALLIPAILGLMHMVRERRPGYGSIGGARTGSGLLGPRARSRSRSGIWQMARQGRARAANATVLHDGRCGTGR